MSSSAELRSRCTFSGYFSNPLIASGANVAFGAPCFVFSGVAVELGEGEGVSVGEGVSLASGLGEDSFFRFPAAEVLADGECDFFFAEASGDGDADSFFVAEDFFFLCGVAVGVGVEKIFLILSPTVSSVARAGVIATNAIKRKKTEITACTLNILYSSQAIIAVIPANARDLSFGVQLSKLLRIFSSCEILRRLCGSA